MPISTSQSSLVECLGVTTSSSGPHSDDGAFIKTTGSLGNTPQMIARVVGLASDEKEALRGSVFLQCDQASAASIRCTGFHFRLA